MFNENPLWFYLILVNLYVFFLMYYDKRQAVKGGQRISEKNLLFMGMVGGGLGGLLAQKIFHHKTRKKKFYLCFLIGIAVCLLLIVYYH
ncbi:DUF1294 domain-containing protein [Enterococcus sp. MJM12]|uniref:DUF1294 domain-containing protein n=1 Tax=Candidatus Enterococcus myersii TaxID=2815322 RepID=A0ABS3HAC9_9ENTE|nr:MULTISPECIES: DUF1294 domain-containing protein [unclassified Enterococcus]MBO0449553.1 DUF1294 domain-containing protein [Enterococcus sp. MJM12]